MFTLWQIQNCSSPSAKRKVLVTAAKVLLMLIHISKVWQVARKNLLLLWQWYVFTDFHLGCYFFSVIFAVYIQIGPGQNIRNAGKTVGSLRYTNICRLLVSWVILLFSQVRNCKYPAGSKQSMSSFIIVPRRKRKCHLSGSTPVIKVILTAELILDCPAWGSLWIQGLKMQAIHFKDFFSLFSPFPLSSILHSNLPWFRHPSLNR